MKAIKRIFLCSTLFMSLLLINSNAYSQKNVGRIKGKVVDASTGEALFGANLIIKGTSIGAAADLNGNYIINGAPQGKQQILIRYIGYQNLETEITVIANEVIEENFELSSVSIMGEEIIVSVQARGQMGAINQQRANDAISNIVSSDKIKEVPDITAAESIGRLPGVAISRSAGEGNKVVVRGLDPKYTNIKIDGVRLTGTGGDRSVGLNNIAPEMLDGIELTKSLTADKEADAVAGEINLRTKVAESGFKVNGSAMGNYNGILNNVNGYRFSVDVGNRFFDDKLGVLFNVGANRFRRVTQSLSSGYGATQLDPDPENVEAFSVFNFNSANININDTERKRMNTNLTFDFKNDFMRLKFRNNLNSMSDHYENRNNSFAASNNNIFKYNINDGKPLTLGRLHSLNSEFNIGTSKLFIDASYTNTKHENQTDRYNFEDKAAWKQERAVTKNDLYGEYAKDIIDQYYDISNIDLAYLINNTRDTIFAQDKTYTGRLDWKVPYNFGEKISGYIKIGGMHTSKNRVSERDAIESYYHGGIGGDRADRIFEMNPDFLRPSDIDGYVQDVGIPAINFEDKDYDYGEVLKGEYELGWSVDLNKLKEVHDYNKFNREDQQFYYLGISSSLSDYETTEKYSAAYIMAQIKLGSKIMILPGLRYEHMSTSYQSVWVKENPFDPSGVLVGYPQEVEFTGRANSNLFPSVNFKYEIFNWMTIRAAYFKSASRPNYSKLAPTVVSDLLGTALSMQNPYLLPETANNYDFGISFHADKFGFFTANVFYKEITNRLSSIGNYNHKDFNEMVGAPQMLLDQINQHLSDSTLVPRSFLYDKSGKPQDVAIDSYSFNNPESSFVRGLELSWQTNFSYLPGLLKGLVLDLNITFIDSEANYPYLKKEREKRPHPSGLPIPYYVNIPYYGSDVRQMGSQPGTIFNARIGYDYKAFSTRLSFRYEQGYLVSNNIVHGYKDYKDDLLRMDLNLQYKISRNLSLTADIANLNNSYENARYRVVAPNQSRSDIGEPYKEWPGAELSKQFYGIQAQFGVRFRY